MGSSLIQAPLPRDGSGRVDLEAVERALAAIAGATPARRAVLSSSAVLIERLSTLEAPPPVAVKVNGHAVTAPAIEAESAPPRRETHSPATPDAPVAAKTPPATDVRGIGRVGPAPVRLEDLAEKPTSFPVPAPPTPQPQPQPQPQAQQAQVPSEPPSIETSAEAAEVAVPDEGDLGPLPPLDARGSVYPPPPSPTSRTSSLPPVAPSPVITPAPAALSPAPPAPAVAASRPLFNPFPGGPGTRATYGSLPIVPAAQPPETAPAEEVGAVFDEFLDSAPVEPAPRPAPPPNVPRASPSLATGLRRSPSLQVPVFRPPPVPMGPASGVSRSPPARIVDDEAIEPVEVEEMEVEEIVTPAMSRPPALPPLPPKKR
ncbi:MAG: hypothetical protein Q8S73_04230 [Deltaproteobacteria bacterium]|nr:hypothetical protein [Myxococcales bacterium]MDP3213286.1 hypothetical protein [Deltaproteobacteria bacterium]